MEKLVNTSSAEICQEIPLSTDCHWVKFPLLGYASHLLGTWGICNPCVMPWCGGQFAPSETLDANCAERLIQNCECCECLLYVRFYGGELSIPDGKRTLQQGAKVLNKLTPESNRCCAENSTGWCGGECSSGVHLWCTLEGESGGPLRE